MNRIEPWPFGSCLETKKGVAVGTPVTGSPYRDTPCLVEEQLVRRVFISVLAHQDRRVRDDLGLHVDVAGAFVVHGVHDDLIRAAEVVGEVLVDVGLASQSGSDQSSG